MLALSAVQGVEMCDIAAVGAGLGGADGAVREQQR